MNAQLISVIIPVYNCATNLESCIESILSQTYENLQIIIVNDGSSDGSNQICKKYAANDQRIEYYEQTNSGVSTARNLGITKSNGKFLMFVDGDDKLSENSIELLFKEIDDDRIDIVCGCCNLLFNNQLLLNNFYDHSFIANSISSKRELLYQLLDGKYGANRNETVTAIGVPWGKLYKRDFLMKNNLLFDSKLRRQQDNIFNMYAFCYANKIKYINKPVYIYRVEHINSYISMSKPDNTYGILEYRERFFREFPEYFDNEMNEKYMIEVNRSISSSIMYYCHYFDKEEAIKSIKELTFKPIYKRAIDYQFKYSKPCKQFIVRLLLYFKLYNITYLIVKKYLDSDSNRVKK